MIARPSRSSVSSGASDEQHAIDGFAFSTSPGDAWNAARAAVAQLPRTEIISQTDDYLHAEFQTSLFRFIDDVEMRLHSEDRTIEIRSRSRVGRQDFMQNRKRIEQIRSRWHALRERDSR